MEINKCVTFEDVCPPAVTKKEKAAKVFYALLGKFTYRYLLQYHICRPLILVHWKEKQQKLKSL